MKRVRTHARTHARTFVKGKGGGGQSSNYALAFSS